MPDELDHHPLRVAGPPPRRRGSDLAALVAAATGALLLFAGYWGISDSRAPGDQLPYFASSTIPGLALIVVAAVLLVRHEHARDREELRALAARFDAVIDWLANDTAGDADPAPSANGAAPRAVRER
jgi:hypothetical protein